MSQILVLGGAGYIGSHMVLTLLEKGHDVIVYDNLSTGYEDAIKGGIFIKGDLADKAALRKVFESYDISAVMHFAAFIQVGESVEKPQMYYQNNLTNTLNVLDTMVESRVKNFIFSSTAAVYGEPQYTPIDVNHPKAPCNPYGSSKWMVEQILEDYDHAYGLKSIRLRYFNAAGADPKGRVGERHEPETHLIPLILQAASGKRDAIYVNGRDYKTEDGTCVRDYIHVTDLCQAHLLALEVLRNGSDSAAYNLGNGHGYSVQQVIDVAKQISGKDFPVIDRPRRAGDPAILIADAGLAKEKLGWQPEYAALEDIVAHAWAWESRT